MSVTAATMFAVVYLMCPINISIGRITKALAKLTILTLSKMLLERNVLFSYTPPRSERIVYYYFAKLKQQNKRRRRRNRNFRAHMLIVNKQRCSKVFVN